MGNSGRQSSQRQGKSQASGASLFRGLRINLTLWYCAVLGAALVLFGVVLYLSTQQTLNQTAQVAQNRARTNAEQFVNRWVTQDSNASSPCSPPAPTPAPTPIPTPTHERSDEPSHYSSFAPPSSAYANANLFSDPPREDTHPPANQPSPSSGMVVCFDPSGKVLPDQNIGNLPHAFLDNHVIRYALNSSSGTAFDNVDFGSSSEHLYLYAEVAKSTDGQVRGVVVAGEYILASDKVLAPLLTPLLAVGAGTLLLAGLSGLFLAQRALAPARLAWTNQQRFIADASHELRTPLTLMRADAEVLLRGRERLPSEDAALLEDIITEAEHMAHITTSLLTLARLDNQSIHREHEVVDLTRVAAGVVRRVQALADQRQISVREKLDENAYVIGDPGLLEQTVLILVDNAIKYNREHGQVEVRIHARDGHVLLEVQDNGMGIAPEHLPYLGERFYRADKARSRAAGGTGLGLSIARGIAHLHGGDLDLESQPGQGTTATLTLPLAHVTKPATPV